VNTYKRRRFPPEIIQYAVWLYFRFNLNHQDIEELLAQRGIEVTRDSIRFGYGVSNLEQLSQNVFRENTKVLVTLISWTKCLSK
jgi:transposase-like protein